MKEVIRKIATNKNLTSQEYAEFSAYLIKILRDEYKICTHISEDGVQSLLMGACEAIRRDPNPSGKYIKMYALKSWQENQSQEMNHLGMKVPVDALFANRSAKGVDMEIVTSSPKPLVLTSEDGEEEEYLPGNCFRGQLSVENELVLDQLVENKTLRPLEVTMLRMVMARLKPGREMAEAINPEWGLLSEEERKKSANKFSHLWRNLQKKILENSSLKALFTQMGEEAAKQAAAF